MAEIMLTKCAPIIVCSSSVSFFLLRCASCSCSQRTLEQPRTIRNNPLASRNNILPFFIHQIASYWIKTGFLIYRLKNTYKSFSVYSSEKVCGLVIYSSEKVCGLIDYSSEKVCGLVDYSSEKVYICNKHSS